MTRKPTDGNDDNPMITPSKRLVAPRGMKAAERKVFKAIVSAKPATFFESGDMHNLLQYCALVVDIDDYVETLKKEGRFLDDRRGIKRPHPALAALSAARNALHTYSNTLKLNPRARQSGLTKSKIHREAARQEAVERSGKRRPGLMYQPPKLVPGD